MEEGLKIQIGADVTELIAGLSKASAALKAFGSTGTAGAKEIEKAIKQLSKSTKGLSGEELERVNTLIAKLRDLSVQLGTKAAVSINLLGDSFQNVSADAATLTPQIEKLSDAITKIPEGSFAVSLDADVASYLPKIEGASEALRQLGQTGIIAGNQAEAALLELGKAAQQAGTADLVKLNAAISAIGSASEKFKTTGVQAFDSFGASVQQAASKVAIVGPAIANAVKEVEVIKSSGFTIKINAETQEAIQGLRFVSKETKALGVTGEASIGQVEKAIIDLNKQLKNGGGGAAEVQRLNTALAGLKSASANFNVDGSVKNLGVLEDKAKDVKAAVTDLSGVNVTTTFNVQGTEASKSQVDSLGASIDQVRAESDVEILLNVQAQQAISNLNITSDALERLGTTGKGSIAEVNIAIAQLQQAARNASGVELAGITLALKNISESSSALGINAANGFGVLQNSAADTLSALSIIPPAVQKIADSVDAIDGVISITPNVNEQGAVNNLEHVADAAIEAKDKVEELGATSTIIKVTTDGIEDSIKDVDKLDKDLTDLRKNGDFELELSVDAAKAIKNVQGIEDILDKLGRTGELSLKDIRRAMDFLAQAAKKPGANIEHINAAMAELNKLSTQLGNSAKSGLDKLGNAVDTTSKKLTKVRPASAQASDSLRDLGRIATDAPFGFIAISNNIQPLIDSLGNLSAASKGPLGALKALGGALLGPAGIGIAIATVTGAVTLAVQKYGSLGEAIDALVGKTNAAKEAAKELAKANSESFTASGKELGYLKSLITVAKDKSRSDIERKDAVLELQRTYPSYFANLSQEAILNGDVADATRLATQAIYDKARAAAGAKRVEDLAGKELQNTQDALEATKEYTAALEALNAVQKDADKLDFKNPLGNTQNSADAIIDVALQRVQDAKKQLEKVGKESVDIQKQLNETFSLLTGTDIAEKDKLRLKTLDDIVKKNQDLIDSGNKEKDVQQALNDALAEQYSIKAKAANVDAATIAAVSASIKAGAFKQKLDKDSEKSLDRQIALLEDLRKTVGLNINEEQKLLDLRIQAAALTLKEQGATPTQAINKINQIKTQFEIEGIDNAIEKLQKFGELLDLTRSKRESIFELKFKKVQLENPDLTVEELKIVAANLQRELDLNPLMITLEYEYPKVDTSKIKKPDYKDLTNPTTGKNRETEKSEAEKEEERLKKLADTISQDITPVFTSLFDVIGKDGASALETLGDSLKQLLKQLAAAAAQAAIFAAIMTAISPAGSATKALGFGGNFLKALGLGAANLGNQNRRFVQGNAANLGRDELYTQLRGRDIDIMIRRNNSSNNRYS